MRILKNIFLMQIQIVVTSPPLVGYFYITISTLVSVCPSGIDDGVVVGGVPLLSFKFLLSYHKVSLIKVAYNVLKVKNMNSRSLPDP